MVNLRLAGTNSKMVMTFYKLSHTANKFVQSNSGGAYARVNLKDSDSEN